MCQQGQRQDEEDLYVDSLRIDSNGEIIEDWVPYLVQCHLLCGISYPAMIGQNDWGRKPRVEIWWEYDKEPSSYSATGNSNIGILNGYIDKGKKGNEENRRFRKHD
jgi:hypothetical protein